MSAWGPDVVTDPAFLVNRSMEDFVTGVDSSKIKRHVLEYNEERDDFESSCPGFSATGH
jgi:U3 small nucleolar ribonucleoprotein protein IMP3